MADRSLTLEEFWNLSEKERCERYKDLSAHDKFGVRQGMETGVVSVPCNECVHYRGYAKCDAFPDGIDADHIQALIKDASTVCGSKYRFIKKRKM